MNKREKDSTLICEEGFFTVSDAAAPELLSFELSVKNNLINVSFESDLPLSSCGFSGPGKKEFTLTHDELRVLPHEMVAQCKGLLTTDVKLSSLSILRDDTDRLSPDGISYRDDGRIEVLEVKTSRVYHNLSRVFAETKAKYLDALSKRVFETDIVFCILVVCPTGVYSNLLLSSTEVDALVSHYLFGNFIQDSAKAQGWDPEKEFQREKALRDKLSEITLDTEKVNCRGDYEPLHIDSNLVRAWFRLPDYPSEKIFDLNMTSNEENWKQSVYRSSNIEELSYTKFQTRYQDFKESMTFETKTNMKPILRIPLIVPVRESPYTPGWRSSEISNLKLDPDCLYGKLWHDAFIECTFSADRFDEHSMGDCENQIEEKGYWEAPPETVSKSKRFVVKLDLTPQQRFCLASRGVQAKSLKKDVDIEDKKKMSKVPYSMDTPTEDIELAIGDPSYWLQIGKRLGVNMDTKIGSLITKALAFSRDTMSCPNEEFLRNFESTRIGKALDLFHHIVSEVNISRLKNVAKDRFILKRLPFHQMYLLIKPTSTDKQIFFSLLIPKDQLEGSIPLSEPLLDIGGCFCTEFVSLDRHKITHYLYCQYKMCSMLGFWNHQFMKMQEEFFPVSKQVAAHFWMSMLVYLEDKEKTSSALQLIRYAYMEVVKGGVFCQDPGKIFLKMDNKVRSRLLVHCIKSFYSVFLEMSANHPQVTRGFSGREALASEDKVGHLLSWVDGSPIANFEAALNLSYLGVLHNKEEGDLVHGYLKIFDKVIDQELKLENARPENMTLGTSLNAASLRDHEFSAVAVKSFANSVKKLLGKKHGDYDSWVQSALSTSVLRRTFEDLATSKASAPDCPEDGPPDEDAEEQEFHNIISKWKLGKLASQPRPSLKCVENIYDLLLSLDSGESCPFFYLEKFLAELESSGGITVKLFKKLQIGGTREIFILPIRARIVINYLELVSRTICEELPCEMLTKGDQKVTRSDLHFRRKAQFCGNYPTLTAINSDDAATWAQRFVMPVFGVMFSVLVPDPFFSPLIRVLNLVTSKRLCLPFELLQLFKCYRTVETFNDNMRTLKEEYLNISYKKERRLVKLGSNLMTNRSNMMQGILHYCSSLLHSCFITAYSAYVERRLGVTKVYSGIHTAVVTGKVSSDDSSFLISAAMSSSEPSEKVQATAAVVLSAYCSLKGFCYPLFCSKQSYEKSTVGNMNLIEEFNSLWYFRNTLLSPSIKFVSAAVRTHVTDKFELRQNVMSGLRSQVLENTGSIFLTSIVLSCQARAHYMALGAASNPLFSFYRDLLDRAPHPALGFFLMDHHKVAGVMGHKLNLYNATKNSESCSKVSKMLLSSAMLSLEDQAQGCASISFTQGSRTRFLKMLDRMSINYEAVLDHYDNNPSELYERALSKDSILNKIALKATTPSLANSFEFLTDSKQHAASSYVLQTQCVFIKERRLESLDRESGAVTSAVSSTKLSLCGLVQRVVRQLEGAEKLNFAEESTIFPNKNLFEDIMLLAQECCSKDKELTSRERKIFLTVSIPKYGVTFLATPSEAVKSKWFGLPTKFSKYEVDQTWLLLQAIFPWIKQSYSETLLHSPLGSSVAIYQFFKSLPTTLTGIKILAPAYKKTTTYDSLKEIILKSQWPGYILKSRDSSSTDIGGPIKRSRSPSPGRRTPSPTFGAKPSRKPTASFLKRDTAKALATALWFEASLPEYAKECLVPGGMANKPRVNRIFNDCKTIIPVAEMENASLFSQLPNQEATLAIFQAVVKHGQKDISKILACAKRGLVGSYVVRASYDESRGIYTGPAMFRGTFNGVSFELESVNEMVTGLVLHEKSSLRKIYEGFSRVVRDLRCNFNAREFDIRDQAQGRIPVDYVNLDSGTVFSTWAKGRIALYISKNFYTRLQGLDVHFSSRDGVLRLMDYRADLYLKQNQRKRPYVVLSYKPNRPSDPSESWNFAPHKLKSIKPIAELTHDPYDVYVSGTTPSLKWSSNLLALALKKHGSNLESVYPKINDWLKATLRERAEVIADILPARVVLSAYATGKLKEEELEPEDEEEVTTMGDDFFSLMDFEADFDAFEEVCSNVGEDILDLKDSSIDGFLEEYKEGSLWADYDVANDEELLDSMTYRPALSEPLGWNALRRSPFWDKYLTCLKQNSSVETRNKAFRGEFQEGCSIYLEQVARLFGATVPAPRPDDEAEEFLF